MPHRILVTGASIAGNTAAWWLARHGHDVTVVERAEEFRDGGQNVDVRGQGREVLRRMGLDAAALAHGTGETGTAWVDESGRVAACFMLGATKGDGMTAEMEILRGDLARLLYEAVRERVTFRFGDRLAAVEPDTGEVTFASGATERYDAVIVAEGVGSATRELVLPGANDSRWMDMTIGYFTVPRTATDDTLWRWYNAPRKRSVSLRPDNHGTTRAMLIAHKPPGGEQDWDAARQKASLRDTFADAGWEAPRVLAAMDEAQDFYFEVLRQVRMPRWSKGRVALVGDAAWCATPLAGMGTTLAVVGAYVLAGELARATDVRAGFAAFERVMRPVVEKAQNFPKLVPRVMHPKTRLGIGLLHGALGLAARPAVQGIAARFAGGARGGDELENYGAAVG